MYSSFVIIVISLLAAFATEAVSWYLIYRTPDYQRIKKSLEALQAKVDKKKDAAPPSVLSASSSSSSSSGKASKAVKEAKKLSTLTAELKTKQQQITAARFKSTLIVTVTLIALFNLLSRYYSNVVVARLPFHPFPFIRAISHRGLDGEDWQDCSFALLYALSQISIRQNVARWLGFVPKGDSGGFSSFLPQPEEQDK